MRSRALPLVLLIFLAAPAAGRGGPERPPDPEWTTEQNDALLALAARYNEWVPRPGGARERDEILAEAGALGPVAPRAVKNLVKDLVEVARSGPRSDAKGECVAKYEPFPGVYYLAGAGNGKGIFVGLHGGGAGVGDGRTAQSQWGAATGKGLIGVFPTANLPERDTTWQSPEVEAFVLNVIRELKRTFRIDTNRIYLAGHSLGGSGTWQIGLKNADLFAAVSPNAGGCHGVPTGEEGVNALPGGYVANLFDTPIFFTHHDLDPQVDVKDSRAAARELDELEKAHPGGYEHVYIEGQGRNHGFPAGGDPSKIIAWMTRHERDPYPKKIVWEPNFPAEKGHPGKHLFFWLRKRPAFKTVGRNTRIVATREEYRIEVKATMANDISILLSQEMYDGNRPLTVVLNGETKFEGFPSIDPRALLESILENIDPEQVFLYRVDL